MSVTAHGSSWVVTGLDNVLVDDESIANIIDSALTAAAAGTDAYASVLAAYKAHANGGNWGHITTLTAPPVLPAVIAEIDAGSSS